jgi:hypothetical protein
MIGAKEPDPERGSRLCGKAIGEAVIKEAIPFKRIPLLAAWPLTQSKERG